MLHVVLNSRVRKTIKVRPRLSTLENAEAPALYAITTNGEDRAHQYLKTCEVHWLAQSVGRTSLYVINI